ncbi:MAG: choice-of-anchor D domain-containing protein [Deltaproteobacteria bacterium]|nr:choice-of-anchor D domain-containing protein [Deltaproteobacteria bacterium]
MLLSTTSRFATLSILALTALSSCNCDELIGQIPTPEIGILDEDGNVHSDADPWMAVAFGDADAGQSVIRNLKVKNVAGARLHIAQICLVNAVDEATAIRADTPCLGNGVAPFVFPLIIGAELEAGATVDLPVTFRPTSGGPQSVFLRIGSDAGKEPLAAVQLTGRGTDGALCADPLVDFGDVVTGTTETRQVVVTNCGVKPVVIDTFAFARNPDTAFGVSIAGVDVVVPIGPINGGEGFTLDVTFTPAQPVPYVDTRSGDIRATTEAPYANIYDVILIGRGVELPTCRVNVVPQVVNFGGVASNTTQTRQLIVQSVGQCACNLTGFAGPTPDDVGFAIPAPPGLPLVLKGTTGCAADPAGADAAPSSLVVDVTYTSPDRAVPVADRATVEVTTDAPVDPVRIVNLEANGGGAPFCQLDVTPHTATNPNFPSFGATGRYGVVEFGRAAIHIEKRQPITLKNIGNARCNVSQVAYDKEENTLENEFRLEDNAGGNGLVGAFAVDPGQERTFQAVFAPTHTIEGDGIFDVFSFGSYSGSLGESALACGFGGPNTRCNGVAFVTDDTVTITNAADGVADGRFSIGFSGTPVEPSVDVIPSELDFGLVTLDCGSPERRTTLYNTGPVDLLVGQPTVDPNSNPAIFSVLSTSNPGDSPNDTTSGWPLTVAPGNSLSISVRYFARSIGVQNGLLVIPTFEQDNGTNVDGPPVTVPLRGEGTLEREQTDIFDQASEPTVDVLFVVDDSGSMSDDQAQLAQNFPQFFTASNVDDANYHIAVTTTLTVGSSCVDITGSATCADDSMSGHYTVGENGNDRFLTTASPNPESQFSDNVLVSTRRIPDRDTSDGGEGGLRGAFNFLSAPKINDPAINGGFLRDEAKLHVIIVSDEPDQSRGPTDLYIDFFQNLKGFRNSSLVAVSAIAKRDNESCSAGDGDVGNARYEDVVTATNGTFQSLCDQDWTNGMRALGLDSLGLQTEFFLTRAATAETLEVCVRTGSSTAACVPAAQTSPGSSSGYFYDPAANSIVFNGQPPSRSSRIEAHYETFCF